MTGVVGTLMTTGGIVAANVYYVYRMIDFLCVLSRATLRNSSAVPSKVITANVPTMLLSLW